MMKKLILATATLALLFLGACKDPVGRTGDLEKPQELTFQTLYKGNQDFHFQEPKNLLFRSRSEFTYFLNNINVELVNKDKFEDLKSKVNQIDFSKEMLICMSRGARPSSSYEFEITRIMLGFEDKMFVESLEYQPEVGDASISYPMHIISVKRTDDIVEFSDTKIVKDNSDDDTQYLPFVTIFQRSHGIVSESKIFSVLKSKADEVEFLSKVKSNLFDGNGNEEPVSLGNIDYDKEMVIIAHYGWSSSGSNYMLIPAIELKDGKIKVYTKYYIPYIGTDDIGYPVHIVKLDKRSEPIEFTETEEIRLGESESILQGTSWEWFGYSTGDMEAFFTPEYKNHNKYTLDFESISEGNGRLNCNIYNFFYSASNEVISFGEMMVTQVYCGDDLEIEYLTALASVYRYNKSESNLTIMTNHPKYTVLFFRKK